MFDIKKFIKGIRILNSVDQTKSIETTVSNSATANTKLTLSAKQNKDTTLELPNTPIGVATDELVSAQSTQTLTNKTLTNPVMTTPDINGGTIDGVTINNSPIGQTTPDVVAATTLTATSASVNGDVVTTNTATQTLTNKTLTSPTVNTPSVSGGSITGSTIENSPIGATTPSTGNFTSVTATSVSVGGAALVTETGTQTLTNKSLVDASTAIIDSSDATKKIKFNVVGNTATTTTLTSSQTADRTLTLPDITDTVVTRTNIETLTNKTLSNPSIDGGTIDNTQIGTTVPAAGIFTTMAATSGTINGSNITTVDNTQSLTNKTLVDASTIIADETTPTKKLKFELGGATAATTTTIASSQTVDRVVTLPDATDTLVGKNTTDTLTNKSISGSNNTITNVSLTSSVSGTLPIANGGTNNNALSVAAGGLVYTDGTKLANVGVGTSKFLLQSNGTSAPSWVAPYSISSIAATSIDWSLGTTFNKTLSANTTFTFANPTAGQTIVVVLTNTASNFTVTWPTVRWANGTAPTMTTGAKTDVYTFIYDGTNYYGSAVQNMS